ncbi:MAG TPA: SDR family oxidoreductase [Solirubrobacteraceae bacterium]|nr:SDR family oxidoreductase [Solirubrobacteraceae bacterium]
MPRTRDRLLTQDALEDRVALVTGAGRGIGREIALGLAGRGATVALASRTHAELQRVAAELQNRGGNALAVCADVADSTQLERLVATVRSELGPVDLLINNAAVVWPLGPTSRLHAAEIRQALAVNIAAVIELTGAVLPDMLEAGWGQIVNVSSGIAAHPAGMVGGTVYAAGKAGLEAHTLNLAEEVKGTGIAVNVFRPGGVDTAMQTWIREQSPEEIGASLHERFVASHRDGNLLSPHESAAALLRRLPAKASGQIWHVTDRALS